MTCEECRLLKAEDAAFPGCGVEGCEEEVEGEAADIIWLYLLAADQLRSFGEMGGGVSLDLNAVRFLLEIYDVPVYRWAFYTEWIKVLVGTLVIEPLMRPKDGSRS